MNLLEVRNLVKHFDGRTYSGKHGRGKVRAVDGVSLSLKQGEVLALVGESGCGKSTFARLVTRLEEKTAGEIIFDGRDISGCTGRKLRLLRRHFQIIFQDSASSLNPRWKAFAILEEPLLNYGVPREQRRRRVLELMQRVGLDAMDAYKYPHEFSGGQRQRINIARALALEPSLLVCDEPVSSLDVSIRAQVLNLLRELKERLNLSYLFISHDLAAVSSLACRVAVMYLGQVVEVLPVCELQNKSCHPYTRALVEAVPEPGPRRKGHLIFTIRGEPPDPSRPPQGCRFHPRCPEAAGICREVTPVLKEVGEARQIACHLRPK